MKEKIPNNMFKIADKINRLGHEGVEAVGDDGSVCVQVKGSKERTWDIAKLLEAVFSGVGRIGDGVQEGSIWINNDEQNIHDELSEVVNLF